MSRAEAWLAKGRYGDLRTVQQEALTTAEQRSGDIRAEMRAAAEEATQPRQPDSREGTNAAAASAAPAEPEIAASPHTAASEPDAVRELAATAEAAVDRAVHAVFQGLGKLFSGFVHWLADSIAPPPPLTGQQAELQARSNAERQEQQAAHQVEQDKRAQEDWLIAEMRRSQEAEAARDPRLAAMMQLHAQPSSARQQETDRELERDRD